MMLVRFLLKCYNYSLLKVYKLSDRTMLYCVKKGVGVLLSLDDKANVLSLEESDVSMQDVEFRMSLGM